ncbi:DUF4333 domain-containing protein [Tsukamurella sp. PLM1]|uniref:DUF4333 domain-containing protein n=1 Tax=Tsukamurella sp. PLM1 TaxID=2929795 RepID=UPI002063929D|nr:DUF4333 domain-containing protein [Tsukamurella sp. PLM1]BDH57377.1 hypothetical protein MTP03_23160 [Tsukamurella sp. PLM1]
MKMKIAGIAALVSLVPLTSACGLFDTKLDFDKLESQISDKLDAEYSKAGYKVDSVSCDKSESKPKPGAVFTCDAKVKDAVVPVKVTVRDKDMNVDFITTAKLYDLAKSGTQLEPEVSAKLNDKVTVDCGNGLKAVEPDKSYTCKVTDSSGAKGTLTYKVGPMDGQDSWEVKPD